MARRHRYLRPFQGVPKALPLSGLFLFAPDVDMKLLGQPKRRIFQEMGKESLFKRAEQQMQRETPAAAEVLRELVELCADAPIHELLAAAARGDAQAQAKIDAMGLWEATLYHQWAEPGEKLSPQSAFILAIERACKLPMQLVHEYRFADAAAILAEDPIMQHFLTPEALALFSGATEPLQLLPLQASVALEIRLSLVALVDVTVARKEGKNGKSCFDVLISTEAEYPRNPTSLFFQWLKTEVGADTITALLNNDDSESGTVDISTLKRWSNGSHQPNETWLRALTERLFGDAEYEPLWNRYWASRYLNFIGYLAATLVERASSLHGTAQAGHLAPWPQLPFGYASIPTWMQARYPAWLAYHRSRLVSL